MHSRKDYLESLPKKRMGVGVILTDKLGRILMLKPSYKDHWTIPGGVVEKDESPREAGERETEEEIGLKAKIERLLAVSYNKANGDADESLQWFFYGGRLTQRKIAQIKIDGEEIVEFRFMDLEVAAEVAEPGVKRRLGLYRKLLKSTVAVYLEDNQEV